jgi:hypothetical protein
MLIVFDRLFGTFAQAPHDEKLRYGLVGGTRTRNPIRIAFNEWIKLWRDFRAAPSLGAKFRTLFSPPGSATTLASPQQPRPLRANAPTQNTRRHQ